MPTDTHCHLSSFMHDGSLQARLEAAAQAGIARMIAVGTGQDDWASYRDLAAAHPGRIYHSVGIHPCHVEADWEEQFMQLAPFFADTPAPVALGEIGLDRFHLPKDPAEAEECFRRQHEALRRQLSLAVQFDCPVIIHSRNAFHECVRAIDDSGVDWRRIVFHCFSEGPAEMRILNERGGRGSFTGILTYKNADAMREACLLQGLDRLMLETDSPYLSPQPCRGKVNEPAFLRHTAEFAAALFGVSFDELCTRTDANATRFFGLREA